MSRRVDRSLTTVQSPSRALDGAASGAESFVDYPKLVKELRAKLQLAGEMGKALLETNASIASEKTALRDSLDLAIRRGDATAQQVAELMHDNDDLRTRLASLRGELARFESTNLELSKALEQQQHASRIPERKEAVDMMHDAEKLLTKLNEEEQKNSTLNLQLSRARVDADRFKDTATLLEEQNNLLVRQLEEAKQSQHEHLALQQHCKTLESANEELGASLTALEQMHAKSDEWMAVSALLLSSPDFLQSDQMISVLKDLQSGLSATGFQSQNLENVREMAAFLTSSLPQAHRWLVAAAAWKREYCVKRDECESARRENARLVAEVEMLEAARKGSESSSEQLQQFDGTESLADLMGQADVSSLQQQMKEAEERWDAERKQLLELVKPFRSNLADLQSKNHALNQALQEVARLKIELENRAPPDTLKRVQELEDELKAQTLLVEESRRRLAEALLERNNLAQSLRRIEESTSIKGDGDRRQSVGGHVISASVHATSHAPRLLETRAASHAHFGAWQHQSSTTTAKDERKIVERVVALERKIKETSFQAERYQQLFRMAQQQTEILEKENTELRERQESQSGPDLRMELFYSLSLSIKLSLSSKGADVNKNVHDCYEQMVAEQWPTKDWATKILQYFGAVSLVPSPAPKPVSSKRLGFGKKK